MTTPMCWWRQEPWQSLTLPRFKTWCCFWNSETRSCRWMSSLRKCCSSKRKRRKGGSQLLWRCTRSLIRYPNTPRSSATWGSKVLWFRETMPAIWHMKTIWGWLNLPRSHQRSWGRWCKKRRRMRCSLSSRLTDQVLLQLQMKDKRKSRLRRHGQYSAVFLEETTSARQMWT